MTKLFSVEKSRNHHHIIGQEYKRSFVTADYPGDDHVFDGLSGETYDNFEQEINDIIEMKNGSYSLDDGDFTYYIEISEEIKDQGFGIVRYMGMDFALTQQAYIDGPADGTPYYHAEAVDSEGNEYEVIWEVKENWEEIEDESDMCEWDKPADVIAI